MKTGLDRRDFLRLGGGAGLLSLLAACDTAGFNFAPLGSIGKPAQPSLNGQSFGTGPVKVALLLPLSGDAALAAVGVSMAQAAVLAMGYIASTPRIGDNITLTIMDTGGTPAGASQQASAAIGQKVGLILGPLAAAEVEAAGAVAKSAGVPLIGFSNNPAAAAPGVYLLNVLPETEIRRSLGYAVAHGKKAIAAVFPATDFGAAQRDAFETVIQSLGLDARSTFSFSGSADMRNVVEGVGPQIRLGRVDSLFLPDRASAPGFAQMLQRAGVPTGKALIIGSADWDHDQLIATSQALTGAVFPAVDSSGYQTLAVDYKARFGIMPHPLATIAYTAVILANASPLALARPRYSPRLLTAPGGFNGRDGVFRFLPDGRSQYALVMKQVTPTGVVQIEGAKL